MKIKILRTVGRKDTLPKNSDNPNSLELPAKADGSMYVEGEVAELKKEDAEKFIACSMGEQTDEPVGLPPKPAPVNAVPVRVVDDERPGNKDTRDKK